MFPPEIDGVADYTFLLGKELAKKHEIYYINRSSLAVEQWGYQAFKKAYRQIQDIRPHLISLQYVPFSFHPKGLPFLLILFWLLLRIKGQLLQVTFHEVAIGFSKTSWRQNFGALAQRLIAWLLCFISQAVFTSVGLYYAMLKPFNQNTKQVFIGANLPWVQKCSKDQHLIICSFNNRINFTLLETLSKLIEADYPVKLVGIGKISDCLMKELRNSIEQLNLQDHVNLKNPATAIDLSQEMAKADIYIQMEWTNEKGEGGISLKSGALMAAMFNQLPIISTFGKMTDLDILNESTGVLFYDHKSALIDQIKVLADDENYRLKLALHAKAFYSAHCTWEKVAQHYEQLADD